MLSDKNVSISNDLSRIDEKQFSDSNRHSVLICLDSQNGELINILSMSLSSHFSITTKNKMSCVTPWGIHARYSIFISLCAKN